MSITALHTQHPLFTMMAKPADGHSGLLSSPSFCLVSLRRRLAKTDASPPPKKPKCILTSASLSKSRRGLASHHHNTQLDSALVPPRTVLHTSNTTGAFDRHETVGGGAIDQPNANARSSSPVHAGKRSRPLSYLHPSSSLLRGESNSSSTTGAQGLLGFSQHFKNADASSSSSSWRDRDAEELTALRREVRLKGERGGGVMGGRGLMRLQNIWVCFFWYL